MTREQMHAYARQMVAEWPALTATQRLRLAVLLRPDLPVGIRRPVADQAPAGRPEAA